MTVSELIEIKPKPKTEVRISIQIESGGVFSQCSKEVAFAGTPFQSSQAIAELANTLFAKLAEVAAEQDLAAR
jgi:hypothetical protein